jgi:hypothetical protein
MTVAYRIYDDQRSLAFVEAVVGSVEDRYLRCYGYNVDEPHVIRSGGTQLDP